MNINQLSQIFRFVIPGGFFLIYFLIFSYFFGIDLTKVEYLNKDYIVLIIFLIPAFGYLASSIHHFFYNTVSFYRINLKDVDNSNDDYAKKWAKFNIRWRINSNKYLFESLDKRNNALTDLMHGNGTILMSYFLSLIINIALGLNCGFSIKQDCCAIISNLVIIIFLLLLHIFSYKKLKNHTEQFVTASIKEMESKKYNTKK